MPAVGVAESVTVAVTVERRPRSGCRDTPSLVSVMPSGRPVKPQLCTAGATGGREADLRDRHADRAGLVAGIGRGQTTGSAGLTADGVERRPTLVGARCIGVVHPRHEREPQIVAAGRGRRWSGSFKTGPRRRMYRLAGRDRADDPTRTGLRCSLTGVVPDSAIQCPWLSAILRRHLP